MLRTRRGKYPVTSQVGRGWSTRASSGAVGGHLKVESEPRPAWACAT